MLRSPGTAKIMVTDKKSQAHLNGRPRPAQIAWAKLRGLRAGAALASNKLWS
jgi:hypothetical protein